MENKGLASFLIGLLQTCKHNGSTQIIINTEEADGVNWLTVEDDGIGGFEIESEYLINANKEILIEQNSVTQKREISLLLCEMERANLSKTLELPFKYSPIPIVFNGEKFGGANYFVSQAMQKVIFNPSFQ